MHQTIGVLALQGDFEKHEHMLHQIGIKTTQVRKPSALNECVGLIIPGGESTTQSKLIQLYDLYHPIQSFSQKNLIMGTCAGVILLGTDIDDNRIVPLKLLNISISRNAYGRQIDSFVTYLNIPFIDETQSNNPFKCVFIRAPQITHVGNDVHVLMTNNSQPIMVQAHNVLGITFHPELTDDTRIHQFFVDKAFRRYREINSQ